MSFCEILFSANFLCIKLFLDLPPMNSSLDYGCGSGILGLAHKIVTPKAKVDFIDIDESALENCRQNIAINNFPIIVN